MENTLKNAAAKNGGMRTAAKAVPAMVICSSHSRGVDSWGKDSDM